MFPDVQQVQEMQLRIQASDNTGAKVADEPIIRVYPLSPSGKLRTILGGPGLPGVHWVITGDGYTSAEQALLLMDASSLAGSVLDTSEIQLYKSAWNVHVLEAISNESGVSLPLQMVQHDTIFEGALGCYGIDRLLCVNIGKVQSAVANELPGATQIIVIGNTGLYGGSGGAVAAVTRHSASSLIALHELGHSFAHLADEYVDGSIDVVIPFSEASFANVTQVTDLATVKWRHWFDPSTPVPTDPGQAGVGLFEGAFYQPTGYYRPTDNSFMRALGQPMGPVNTEAWAQSIYEAAGAVQEVTPIDAAVTTMSGLPASFSVKPMFPESVQSIRWFVDDSEVTQAEGMAQFSCCGEGPGPHTVRLQVADVSGKIRTPQPGAALYEKSWTVTVQ